MKVQKTIELIKRSYGQPILFHRLHCHLSYTLRKGNPLYEMSDDWSRILVFSVAQNGGSNQGLESKILSFLKEIRPPMNDKESRLKLWIILYYMRSRSPSQVNHLVVFELVSNFMGDSPFVDGLILSVLRGITTSTHFGLEGNKKMRNDAIVHLLGAIKGKSLDVLNRALALPCYISHDVEPPKLLDLSIGNDLQTFVALENVCFYAKYSKSVEFVKRIVPDEVSFIDCLRRFISRSFRLDKREAPKCTIADGVVESFPILDEIRRAHREAKDKEKFVSRIIEFTTKLSK
ncbi:putative suppressor of tubulin [Encephalitozoon hellem]|uniref:Suppressor of tubulin n=1 Tax=Encephalitozoon hellem TaxID=27973 RepID=A0ABY8CNT4_ENCHE|nr:putative suppressor of tubulin [Encephalitozoon hellem]